MALPLKTDMLNQIYTADEFMALSLDPGKRYELVRGVIKEMSHPGGEHMLVADNLYGELRDYIRPRGLGRVLPPGRFQLKIPGNVRDTVRSPDLTFIPASLVPSLNAGAVKFPPALAVEVYSPNERPGDLQDKLEDYKAAGWNLIWVIYPPSVTPKKKAETVAVYRLQQQGLTPVQELTINEQLSGEEVIPGFTVSVAALFDYQD